MNRIEAIFSQARGRGERLLMPFICAGHPASDSTPPLLRALQDSGAAIVEVGIPFSDPIADGPVIASAMHSALLGGTTPDSVFRDIEQARPSLTIGLVAMVSVSIVYRSGGADGFARRAAQAGFDGVIYPDAPLEESSDLLAAARAYGLTGTLLIAPTTPPDRAEAIASACSGFVYLLARTGITGERGEAPNIQRRVAALRRTTELPIACGFGISTADHVRAVVAHADAAIVGSALVRRMDLAREQNADPIEAGAGLVRDLSQAARSVTPESAPGATAG